MTASLLRRAFRGLLGADRGHLAVPPAREGYSVARRAVAGLLGVRLVTPEEQAGAVPPMTSTSPGQDRGMSAAAAIAVAAPEEQAGLVPPAAGTSPGRDRGVSAAAAIAAADPVVRLTVRRSPLVAVVVMAGLLVRAVDIADSLASGGGRAEDRNLGRAGTLSHDLADARLFVSSLALALDLGFDLSLDLARVRERARERALDSACALAHAREIASVLAGALSDLLGIERLDELADALLDGALDDFSQADLSGVDLAHVDLVGVRWSVSGTWWPPDLKEALRRQSEETEPGSGVYVVMRWGGTDRAVEDARV